jgi:hypothetical protein
MKFTASKKVVAVLGAGTLAVAVSGVAYAYFTSTASGTGSAAAKSNTAITLSGITVSGLAPGLTKTVPFSFTNTAGSGNQNFGTASVVVNTIHSANGKTCTSGLFDLSTTDSSVAVGTVNDGATFSANGTTNTADAPTITMGETGSSQDQCQGATVDLTVSVAQGS